MPVLDRRLTDNVARTIPLPESGWLIYWCPKTPGFGLRVSSSGDRAYISERRINGKTVRRTLGKAAGAKAISSDTARELKISISGELQQGIDRAEISREQRKNVEREAITLADALSAYVKNKRRGKDSLPLKDRTKDDYLAMIKQGGLSKSGMPFTNGMLYSLSNKSIYKINASDIRKTFNDASTRSLRSATYAIQVLRAVLNWHGVMIPDSPLSKETPGKDRIVLSASAGKPSPIPPERLGAWWAAATTKTGNVGADGCRFILLTGCRPGEVFGSKFEPGLLVRNVDLTAGRVILPDTKNRSDHVIALSSQALSILVAHCKGKKPSEKVFDVLDPGKTLATINKVAQITGISPHKLRHTFASVAEELVSGYALKRMLNHTQKSDVTGAHYVGKSESQLRNAWQTVADFIVSQPVESITDVDR